MSGATSALAGTVEVRVEANKPGPVISRNIFGQFAEQLGRGIDEGVWVGPESDIPNVRGIRKDVVAALRDLKVPNVRWPGGCFADQYNWRDGVGPRETRPVRSNIHWGSPVESNQFGTHEYMDFIDQIGSEAHIVANLGTGSAREAAQWLEYMTSDKPTTLAKERAANGRKQPWRVKYFAYGNESYGCGGPMSAETYVERLKIFAMYARNLNTAQSGAMPRFLKGPDPMIRLAVGPAHDQTDYTEAVMKAWAETPKRDRLFDAMSYHYYTPGPKGSMLDPATGFSEADYAGFLKNTYAVNDLFARQIAIMDKYDPEKEVALSFDEWGVWLAAREGTSPLYLEQQSSLRDALIASVHINIFARHADRVRMANIAQMVNVLQAMVQTDGPKMHLTPTYHVFRMYVPFQDATSLPIMYDPGEYRHGKAVLPAIDAIAGRTADGAVVLAVTNIDPNRSHKLALDIAGVDVRSATGEVLTAQALDAVNTFDNPTSVSPREIRAGSVDGALSVELPPASVTVLRLAN
ncbi:MAG: alpha-L-arabinofuranosidase C-terminal domain-containing protein [Sphingomonadaceae bacterium]